MHMQLYFLARRHFNLMHALKINCSQKFLLHFWNNTSTKTHIHDIKGIILIHYG